MSRLTAGCCALMCAAVATLSSDAYAYLGSFTPNDGYLLNSGTILGDVSLFNAGQFGANAGGGSFASIPADSGLWELVGPVGGYFSNPTDRNAAVSAGPAYPTNPPNTAAAYIVGNHFSGRLFDGSNLALRNDTPAGTGPMIYDYSFDTYDFGGPVPSSITSGSIQMQFYFCPNPGDSPQPRPLDKFTMSLRDSLGNIGLQWGYARDNSVYWRLTPTSLWIPTGIIADQTDWDGMRIDVNLSSDTFGIDYFDVGTNTWSTMVPTGTAMGQAMTDFTVLRWQLEDNLSAGVGGKNFFDDFSFSVPVPEPATYVLLCAAIGIACVARLRKV